MPFESELYPPEWRAARRAKLLEANYCCQQCGVGDRTIQLNRNGERYYNGREKLDRWIR